MGLKAGIYNYRASLSDLDLEREGGTGNDLSFSADVKRGFRPNLGVGFYLYTKDYYVGFSAPKLVETDLANADNTEGEVSELKRHYFLSAGYIYTLNSDWKFKPSLINKMVLYTIILDCVAEECILLLKVSY